MNRLTLLAGEFLAVEFDVDDQGVTAANPILPPWKEILLQSIATVIVFYGIYKFAGPAIAKAIRGRSERIQGELDGAAEAKTNAEQEAADIRNALGDIDAERRRLFDEAETQAEALLVDGRARIDDEIAEMHARADAEISGAATRGGDELRAEIGRYSTQTIDRLVGSTLDGAAQQDLIEGFISRVGAESGSPS
ncbi:MAG: hypothetical protein AAGA42_12245 [Actinomycetota bacterium]